MSKQIIISTPEEVKRLFKECVSDLTNHIPSIHKNSISEELVDAKQACIFLNLKIQSLYNLVCKGKIPYKKVKKKLYFTQNDLIRWVENGEGE